MPYIIWSLNTDGHNHQIKLYHSLLGSETIIWIDNQQIEKNQKLVDYGSRHRLFIDGHTFELVILTNGFTYSYFLFQNGSPIPSDKEITQGKTTDDLLKSPYLQDISYWKNLSDYLKLNYIPDQKAAWGLHHRLIGTWKGYPILIQKGYRSDIRKTVWFISIRYFDHEHDGNVSHIAADERIYQLFGGKNKAKNLLKVGQGFVLIMIPVKKKESPCEIGERIRTFFSIVTTYTSPIPQNYCEGNECQKIDNRVLKLVLINGNLLILCQDCISKIPEWGKKSEENYQNAPNNLFPGLIAGIGVALLGAMIWAAIGFLLDTVMGFLSAFILIGILDVMDKAGTKRSKTSLLIASLLTILSVSVGQYSQFLLHSLRFGMPLSSEIFNTSWQALISSPATLFFAYFFTFLCAGVFLWLIFIQQKNYFQQVFQPDVEVISEE